MENIKVVDGEYKPTVADISQFFLIVFDPYKIIEHGWKSGAS